MSGVPYTFATASTTLPLQQLDTNFQTPITIGNTSVALGNTITTIGNLTLTNVTISSGNVTTNIVSSNVNITGGNISGANITGVVGNVTGAIPSGNITNALLANSNVVIGNTTISLGSTTANLGNVTLANSALINVNVISGNVINGIATGSITNSLLQNNSVTIGNTSVVLGSTVSNIGNVSLSNATITNYAGFVSSVQPSYQEARVWYDSTQHALAYFNDATNNVIHIGQETQVKVLNSTGSTIANGAVVYVSPTSSGQTYPNIALAKADAISTSAALGLANGSIANGAIGYICIAGLITGVSTGAFTVGDVLYLSPYSAGQLQNTVPPTQYPIQIGTVAYANSPNGSIYIKQTTPLAISAATIYNQINVSQGGTGVSTITAGYIPFGNGTNNIQTSGNLTFTGNTTLTVPNIANVTLSNTTILSGSVVNLSGNIVTGLVAGTNITLSPANGVGTVTINSSGGGGGGTGAVANGSIYISNTIITTSYSFSNNTGGMSVGPVTIASGITVTITSGSRWVVL